MAAGETEQGLNKNCGVDTGLPGDLIDSRLEKRSRWGNNPPFNGFPRPVTAHIGPKSDSIRYGHVDKASSFIVVTSPAVRPRKLRFSANDVGKNAWGLAPPTFGSSLARTKMC